MTRWVVVAAVAVAAVACGASSITGGASANGHITWRVQDQRVDLTNMSNAPVRYAIIGRTWLHTALAQWCFGLSECGAPLAPSATAKVAYADISGGAPPETEAVVLWWTPNGTGTGPFDTAIVRIR